MEPLFGGKDAGMIRQPEQPSRDSILQEFRRGRERTAIAVLFCAGSRGGVGQREARVAPTALAEPAITPQDTWNLERPSVWGATSFGEI